MAVADRMYTRRDVTLIKLDTDNSVATILGSGELQWQPETIENTALLDKYPAEYPIRSRWTFTGELAAESTATNWFNYADVTGASGPPCIINAVFTDTQGSVSGQFMITSLTKTYNEGIRWRIELRSVGDVTVTPSP